MGGSESKVLVSVKTPMMAEPTSMLLPARLTVREALAEFTNGKAFPKPAAMRVAQQLQMEMKASHFDILRIDSNGTTSRIQGRESLQDLSEKREIKTLDGEVEQVDALALECQGYAPVGNSEKEER